MPFLTPWAEMKAHKTDQVILISILVCIFFIMLAGIALSAETAAERVSADIMNSELDVTVGETEMYFGLSLNMWMQQNIRASNFEFREVGKNIYHLRNTAWKDQYWMIDTDAKKAFRVKDESFGKKGGKGNPIDAVQVVPVDISPEARARSWLKPKYVIRLVFDKLTLDYDTFGKQAKLSIDGDDLVARGDWDVRTIESNKYQFQVKAVPNPFLFEIDINEKKAYQYPVESGTNRPVGRFALTWAVRAAAVRSGSPVMASSNATYPERVSAEIKNAALIIVLGEAGTYYHLSLDMWMQQNMRVTNFEFRELGKNTYHLRSTGWKDFYWKIDTDKKSVSRITGGEFGHEGGAETPLATIRAEQMVIDPFVKKMDGRNPRLVIKLLFDRIVFTYDPPMHAGRLLAANDDLMIQNDWDLRSVEKRKHRVQLKLPVPSPFFFEIDAQAKKAYELDVETLVLKQVGRYQLPWIISTEYYGPDQEEAEIPEDIEMKGRTDKPTESAWFVSEQQLYRDLLKNGFNDSYDVLVVPFQVQGYAIDRIGRSLMTRYLAHRIEATTDARVPSPTIVAKALGELSRTFKDETVNELAFMLKARTIIRGYVGHDRMQRMTITIKVQTIDRFPMPGPPVIHTWKDVPISDEKVPEDVFAGLLDEIMAKLPLKQTKKVVPNVFKKESRLQVPDSLPNLTGQPSEDPVRNAYALQLLGSLYPEPNEARESLFERSLVALSDVSPKSPDYSLLKTRADYYLQRRPAALAALGSASGPEAKALRAVLMGNILELRKLMNAITDPLPRLLAQIEYVDLSRKMLDRVDDRSVYEETARTLPGWKVLVHRRFDAEDPWDSQNNYPIKALLDKMLPVPGATAEDMSMHRAVMGPTGDGSDEMEMSVYLHRRMLLEKQGADYVMNESGRPVKRDILDLLSAVGESNLLKQFWLRAVNQSLYEDAISELERYDAVYHDHPDDMIIRSIALYGLARSKQGILRTNMEKQSDDLKRGACISYQGQTGSRFARWRCPDFFEGDFPRRSYWSGGKISQSPGDRDARGYHYFAEKTFAAANNEVKTILKNYDVTLKYTSSDFHRLENYYGYLQEHAMPAEAEKLVEANRDRFIGSPLSAVFFAEVREKAGDLGGARKLYAEAIAAQPKEWKPYEKLGAIYLRQGEYRKASELYRSYPLFNQSGDELSASHANTVQLSHQAYDAGDALFWIGAIEEAIPLFRRSAGFQTGSGSEMLSEATLLQIEQNYAASAQVMRDLANRYGSKVGYRSYAAFLHAMGFHEEAWSLFKKREMIKDLLYYMMVPLVGHRVEGKAEEEQRQWFLKQDLASVNIVGAQEYLLVSHLYDRDPEEGLSDIIAGIDRRLVAARNHPLPAPGQERQSWESPRDPTKRVRSRAAWFADAYIKIKKKQYDSAYALFKGVGESETCNSYADNESAFVLPYSAWSAVKSGKDGEIEKRLASYKKEEGETFYYHLAEAYRAGGRKAYKNAIEHLNIARFVTPDGKGFQPFSSWYQLVEACEWLYEDSKDPAYRDLAVSYAKVYQNLRPFYGWPYAVEAKYTTSRPDRIRALAMTLYLDRRSERVASLPELDKQAAREWLESNNPFLMRGPEKEKREI